jgi:DNA-binding NarL/FixJ family response regulator
VTSSQLTVAVCLRSPLMSEAVALLLEREPDLIGEAATPDTLGGCLRERDVGAVVVDAQAADRIRAELIGSLPVVLLGRRSSDAGPLRRVVTVPMDSPVADLLAAIRGVWSGTLIPSQPSAAGSNRGRRRTDARQWLTEREQTVVELLADGCGANQIAEAMDVSVHTVRTHVQNVLAKLGAHSQTDAVARARELGLLKRSSAEESS